MSGGQNGAVKQSICVTRGAEFGPEGPNRPVSMMAGRAVHTPLQHLRPILWGCE